ncbi:chromosomal replication initiator protein DnaA [Helicobacter bilis]|uniref:Chromosomal replication initiator protein DnaA n=1 Tax=Helicobacter bilis TaxID=37372 RepID=A0A4V6I5P0_9HELI|nr:chromosomal replication initiator protein DnaA [Helicobacter bilis]MCI7410257.1 chromosomal replication initiator protein DnaA [Helicobacter bilis]MDD7296513.1 chromosomal replication initiator protein DnaA [Helicobacter bilis]MDY4400179.1 chromosomal replication initiator protein DnaA [Helicobacter bilis]TLE07339.1 chromosomal replication initiator protein DnaA [Helicobacter bilis]TLE08736.1 chromosomal replication initiator protein DnaA [Helicobacter bilis]
MDNTNLLQRLQHEIPENEYQQYISKISFDSMNSTPSHLIFIAPNIFIANWAKNKYTKLMLKILEVKTINEIKIEFIARNQHNKTPTENNTTRKYITTNNQTFINKNSSFNSFIVGECNKFAFETAKEIAKNQGKWNPLLIYGNTGLGKTHLLYAICNAVYERTPNAKIVYITAESMFNEYRHRIQNNTMQHFRERFRSCDYLLIDDVQFLSNTDKFQEEFFNTFNVIVQEGGQIVMTSDKAPKLIDKLEKRLKSRFAGGMMTKIESPELDMKINIIKQKCALNNITLEPNIINFIATQLHDNIREIEGTIIDIYANMSIMNIPITLEIVKNILKDREIEEKATNFDDVVNLIAREYNIKPSEIKTKTRGKKIIARSRKIVAYIAREAINTTFPHIATELNLKDHSAVSKQIKSIKQEMEKDNTLKIEVQNLLSKLKQNTQ